MPADFQDMGGRRFYWDGLNYPAEQEAEEAAERYAAEGFEVLVLDTPEGHLVYSRRQAQGG